MASSRASKMLCARVRRARFPVQHEAKLPPLFLVEIPRLHLGRIDVRIGNIDVALPQPFLRQAARGVRRRAVMNFTTSAHTAGERRQPVHRHWPTRATNRSGAAQPSGQSCPRGGRAVAADRCFMRGAEDGTAARESRVHLGARWLRPSIRSICPRKDCRADWTASCFLTSADG